MRWKRHHFECKETIVSLLCKDSYIDPGIQAMVEARSIIETYIHSDNEFEKTHRAYQPAERAPELIQTMCIEARKVEIGPMSSVAGMVAQQCLMGILNAGATEAVIDNGGDIAMIIQEPIRVGIFTGNSKIKNLALEIPPRNTMIGICTSSGTIGHSFSYGNADAAVVISQNPVLADAAATALGNRIQNKEDLDTCFHFLEDIDEIEGALVIFRDKIALWGELPKLLQAEVNTKLITRG